MRWTGRGEGHDGIGADFFACDITRASRALRLHGIGIGARRNIDGDNWSPRRIDLADRRRVERTDWRTKTSAEDCIHDHVGRKNFRRIRRIEPTRLAHDQGGDIHWMERLHHVLKHDGGVSPKFFGIRQQQNAHGAARFDEFASHNESIPAVVALAAENADALGLRVLGENETGDG